MRTLSSYSIKFYFKGRVWFVDLWFFVVVVFLFFFFFFGNRQYGIQNGKSKIKSKASSLQVRGKKVSVSKVILFHMATSNIFRSCFSFQTFFSGAAELLALLNALLSDTRSTASSSF